MTANDLELSHSIELDITVNNKKTTLLSTIEKILNDKTILLAPLRLNGKLLGFAGSSSVNLIYGGLDNTYLWTEINIRPVKFNNEVYHAVTFEHEPSVINRRGTYRVYSGEDMILTTFTHEGPKSISVLVRDISETGMAFYAQDPIDIGRTVRLNVPLLSSEELHLSAQVLRQKNENSRLGTLYGCKFIEKNPGLPRYLMRLQQNQQKRKSGLR